MIDPKDIPDSAVQAGAKAIADVIGHGMAEKCEAQAMAAAVAILNDMLGEPMAFCAPWDPLNSSAFAWPGTDRQTKHIVPLYAIKQGASHG